MSENIMTELVDTNPNTTNVNNININDKAELNIDDLEAQTKVSDDIVTLRGEQPVVQLGRIKLILVMLGLTFGVFLAILDTTIVATTLPAIASEFKALHKIEWVATSYLLTVTVLQPTYGKFSDIFGRKETFLFSIIVFVIGSLLCGLAPNMTSMIIFRAISGIGGGGVISLVFIIISDIVPFQDRGKYQGMISVAFGVASVLGPLLGGTFTDHMTWRWSFYINLPLGAVSLGSVIFFLHIPRPKGSLLQKLKRIDYAGTIVIVGATVALLLSLNWGGNGYAWNSPVIITLLVVGGVGYLLFTFIEAKFAIEPVIPLHLFKRLHIVSCLVANIFQRMAFFGFVYYVPLYFQVVRGDSATESGLALIPYILSTSITSIGTGQMLSRTDALSYRTISVIGAVFITIGAGLISLWNENTGRGPQISYMIISGIGSGVMLQTTLLCTQGIVEYKDVAAVTALIMFSRAIGAVFGIAVVGTVFSNVLSQNLEHISIPISLDQIEAVKQSPTLVSQLDEEIRGPVTVAYVNALRATFIVNIPLGILCFISSIFIGNHKPKINKERCETIVAFEVNNKEKGKSDTNI